MIFLFKTNRNQTMADETKEYEPDELAPGTKAGPPLTKQCSICKQTKEANCFHKHSRNKDGLLSRCKTVHFRIQTKNAVKNARRIVSKKRICRKDTNDALMRFATKFFRYRISKALGNVELN